MNDDELVAMVFLLLVAGHETTVNLIGNGVLALLQHPDQLQWLRDDPERIKSAVEELLRFAGPLETATERYCREDLELAGTPMPGGSLVLVAIASANRDDRQFERPEEVDLARNPNKHLAFGLGPHYCLGAPLARLEAQIAVNTLLQRTDDLRLAVAAEQLRWRGGLVVRGMKSLPVRARILA
jgi:cytochrome P450